MTEGFTALPKYLYRYVSVSDAKKIGRFEDLVIKNKQYFSSPLSFNDPFDCRAFINVNVSRVRKLRYLENLYIDKNPNCKKREASHFAEKTIKGGEYSQVSSKYIMEGMLGSMSVLSLTETKDNMLMWSHYSDSHAGICLAFETGNEFFIESFKVDYQNELVAFDIDDENRNAYFFKMLVTKANWWSYEKEWRIVKTMAPQIHLVPKNILKSVYLGCKIDGETKSRILNILSRRFLPVTIYQCRQKEKEYGIYFEEIET